MSSTRNAKQDRVSLRMVWDDISTLPPLHRWLVRAAMVLMFAISFEGAFLFPYALLRWGWGYGV